MYTIHEAAEALRQRKITPLDLVEECLANIERWSPKRRLGSDRSRGGFGRSQAADRGIRRGQFRGPLHGIPLGIKDIFDVFDWPTAAGSKLWANSVARQDADVIARLRQGGAIFLGKTVTTAYASYDPPVTPILGTWNIPPAAPAVARRRPWPLACVWELSARRQEDRSIDRVLLRRGRP